MHFQRDSMRRAAAVAGIAATIGMVPRAVACGDDSDKAPGVSTTTESGIPSPATSPAVTTMPTGSVESSPVDTGTPPQPGPTQTQQGGNSVPAPSLTTSQAPTGDDDSGGGPSGSGGGNGAGGG
jgi:hypothetical protein